MLRSELVPVLAEKNVHLYQQDVDRIVNIVLDKIMDALKNGSRVELRGVGAFSMRSRNSRQGQNPRTGAAVEVTAKRAPAFKPGKEMRERLNKPES